MREAERKGKERGKEGKDVDLVQYVVSYCHNGDHGRDWCLTDALTVLLYTCFLKSIVFNILNFVCGKGRCFNKYQYRQLFDRKPFRDRERESESEGRRGGEEEKRRGNGIGRYWSTC